MEIWIYQPLHVGYHGKFHANYSLDVIVSTKIIAFEAYLRLTMYLFKRKFPFKMFIQHDNSLGFLDKHICKPISSIQNIKDVKVLFDLPSS
jgi:hypothetical protein